jgi:glycine/serine hydroxymethyltransferase
MVDGNIDPRSVEAMEKFKKYSKEATQNMKGLQQQMDKFTNSMAMTKSHTIDLREALRGVGDSKPFGQTNDISNEVKAGVSNNNQTNDITINLRIDVSGVTDRTDKRALAKEISAMVTKELRTKIGGPLVNSGFSRSG